MEVAASEGEVGPGLDWRGGAVAGSSCRPQTERSDWTERYPRGLNFITVSCLDSPTRNMNMPTFRSLHKAPGGFRARGLSKRNMPDFHDDREPGEIKAILRHVANVVLC